MKKWFALLSLCVVFISCGESQKLYETTEYNPKADYEKSYQYLALSRSLKDIAAPDLFESESSYQEAKETLLKQNQKEDLILDKSPLYENLRFFSGRILRDDYLPASINDLHEAAAYFLLKYKSLFGIKNPEEELRLKRVVKDAAGVSHFRYDQYYKGLEVYGAQLILHIDEDFNVEASNGQFVPGIDLDVVPNLSVEEVLKRYPEIETSKEPRLIVVENAFFNEGKGRDLRLAWFFDDIDQHIFDSNSSELLYKQKSMQGFSINVYDARNHPNYKQGFHMKGRDTNLAIHHFNGYQNGSISEVENAFFMLSESIDYFYNLHQRKSYDNKWGEVEAVVRITDGEFCDRTAAWENGKLMFCQGVTGHGDLVALDIGAHEFTHGVIQWTSGFFSSAQPGALNESFADLFGVIIENNVGDYYFHVGDHISNQDGSRRNGPSRILFEQNNPRSIDDYKNNSHPDCISQDPDVPVNPSCIYNNSLIFSYIGSQIIQEYGSEVAGAIFYKSLFLYLHPISSFVDAKMALFQACKDIRRHRNISCQPINDFFNEAGIDSNNLNGELDLHIKPLRKIYSYDGHPDYLPAFEITLPRGHHYYIVELGSSWVLFNSLSNEANGDILDRILVGDPADPNFVSSYDIRQGQGEEDLFIDVREEGNVYRVPENIWNRFRRTLWSGSLGGNSVLQKGGHVYYRVISSPTPNFDDPHLALSSSNIRTQNNPARTPLTSSNKLPSFQIVMWHPDGTLIRTEDQFDPNLYYLDDRKKRLIRENELHEYNLSSDDIVLVSHKEILEYENGPPMDEDDKPTLHWSGESIHWPYLACRGDLGGRTYCQIRRKPSVFRSWGYPAQDQNDNGIFDVIESEYVEGNFNFENKILNYRDGTVIKDPGALSPNVYVIINSRAYLIPDEDTYYALFNDYDWSRLIVSDYSGKISNSVPKGLTLNQGILGARTGNFNFDFFEPEQIDDDTKPQISLTNPLPETIAAGSQINIDWRVTDNDIVSELYVYITYDGWRHATQRSHQQVLGFREGDVSGRIPWVLPLIETDEAGIYIYALDRAGNHQTFYSDSINIQLEDNDLDLCPEIVGPTIQRVDSINQAGSDNDGYQIFWEDRLGEDYYILEEDDNPNFTSPREIRIERDRFTQIIHQANNGNYYLRMKAANACDEFGPWGESFNFIQDFNPNPVRPFISPLREIYSYNGESPRFDIEVQAETPFFYVEVATDWRLFNQAGLHQVRNGSQGQALHPDINFFSSFLWLNQAWIRDEGSYQMPDAVWQVFRRNLWKDWQGQDLSLEEGGRLYYRVVASPRALLDDSRVYSLDDLDPNGANPNLAYLPLAKWHPDGSLIKEENNPDVYLVESQRGRLILNNDSFRDHRFDERQIVTVSAAEFDFYTSSPGPDYPMQNLAVLRKEQGDPDIWIQPDPPSRRIYHMQSEEAYDSWGYSRLDANNDHIWDEVFEVPNLDAYTKENEVYTLRDGTIVRESHRPDDLYVISNKVARAIENDDVYLALYNDYNFDLVMTVDPGRLSQIVPANYGPEISVSQVTRGADGIDPLQPDGENPVVFFYPISPSHLYYPYNLGVVFEASDDTRVDRAYIDFSSDRWRSSQRIHQGNLIHLPENHIRQLYTWPVPDIFVHEAMFRVTVYDSSGNSSVAYSNIFQIGNEPIDFNPVPEPEPCEAPDGTSITDVSFPAVCSFSYDLHFRSVDGIDKFIIEKDTDPNFSNPEVFDDTDRDDTAINISEQPNGTYYHRIRTVRYCGEQTAYSDWSPSFQVELDCGFVLEQARVQFPLDNAVDVPTNSQICWVDDNPENIGLIYTLSLQALDRGDSLTGVYHVYEGPEKCYQPVDDLRYNQRYLWSVETTDNNGGAVHSETYEFSTLFENTIPEGSIVINNGDEETASYQVNLSLTYQDQDSGVSTMSLSNNGEDWTSWISVSNQYTWNLIDARYGGIIRADNNYTVYVKYRDRSDNISEVSTDSILKAGNLEGIITLNGKVYDNLISAMQNAEEGDVVYLSEGEWTLTEQETVELSNGNYSTSFILRAGVHIQGVGWEKTILNVANDPQYGLVAQSNASISGITFNFNGTDKGVLSYDNNEISYSRFTGARYGIVKRFNTAPTEIHHSLFDNNRVGISTQNEGYVHVWNSNFINNDWHGVSIESVEHNLSEVVNNLFYANEGSPDTLNFHVWCEQNHPELPIHVSNNFSFGHQDQNPCIELVGGINYAENPQDLGIANVNNLDFSTEVGSILTDSGTVGDLIHQIPFEGFEGLAPDIGMYESGATGAIRVVTGLESARYFLSGPGDIFIEGEGAQSNFNNLPNGVYSIQYLPVDGYYTPPNISKVLNSAGQIEFNDLYILDDRGPAVNLEINSGRVSTRFSEVTLRLKADDEINGIGENSRIRLSNDGETWSDDEPFRAVIKRWSLNDFGGNLNSGEKNIYVQVSDNAGHWSDVVTKRILYLPDRQPLVVPDQFQTIAEAVNHAEYGDLIWLMPGNYFTGNPILQRGVSIQGSGMGLTNLIGSITLQNESVLDGVSTSSILSLQGISNLVSNSILDSEAGIQINAQIVDGTNFIKNNLFFGVGNNNEEYELNKFNLSTNIDVVENNIFLDGDHVVFSDTVHGLIELRHNLFVNQGYVVSSNPPGFEKPFKLFFQQNGIFQFISLIRGLDPSRFNGILFNSTLDAEPIFQNPDENNYLQAPNSPYINAGLPDPYYQNHDGSVNTIGMEGGITYNSNPTAELVVRGNPEDASLTLDASNSYDEQNDFDELFIRWDLDGDGTYERDWSTDFVIDDFLPAEGQESLSLQVHDRGYFIDTLTFNLQDFLANLNRQPLAPTNPQPATNSLDNSINLNQVSWNASDPDGDDLSYDLYFGRAGQELPLIAEGLETNSYDQLDNLNYATLYEWYVIARDTEGLERRSPIWNFRIEINPDLDGDGSLNGVDNCPQIANPLQDDLDGDSLGDLCDPDIDGDGFNNGVDNCPLDPTNNRRDQDGDGVGDACDDTVCLAGLILDENQNCVPPDRDEDGVSDLLDNCPDRANAGQEDLDGDALGDLCDDDLDGDATANNQDNCPLIANQDQRDQDHDGRGDLCDDSVCPEFFVLAANGDCNPTDDDNDGVPTHEDNCRDLANADQADSDDDGLGDACDSDRDGDRYANDNDNCPDNANADQRDQDRDGQGDVCDPTPCMPDFALNDAGDCSPTDDDGDSIFNHEDNCPQLANADQLDSDADGIGNLCDNDRDGDGINNDIDNCPDVSNADQENQDNDNLGDLCDPSVCSEGFFLNENGRCVSADPDNDGVLIPDDNCPDLANPDQADTDLDGEGDLCDNDRDGDGVANSEDNCPSIINESQRDQDADGVGDHCDRSICPEFYALINNSDCVPTDDDNDGIFTFEDNCPDVENPDQFDLDRDGKGDLCDNDIDNDGFENENDFCPKTLAPWYELASNGCASYESLCHSYPGVAGHLYERELCYLIDHQIWPLADAQEVFDLEETSHLRDWVHLILNLSGYKEDVLSYDNFICGLGERALSFGVKIQWLDFSLCDDGQRWLSRRQAHDLALSMRDYLGDEEQLAFYIRKYQGPDLQEMEFPYGIERNDFQISYFLEAFPEFDIYQGNPESPVYGKQNLSHAEAAHILVQLFEKQSELEKSLSDYKKLLRRDIGWREAAYQDKSIITTGDFVGITLSLLKENGCFPQNEEASDSLIAGIDNHLYRHEIELARELELIDVFENRQGDLTYDATSKALLKEVADYLNRLLLLAEKRQCEKTVRCGKIFNNQKPLKIDGVDDEDSLFYSCFYIKGFHDGLTRLEDGTLSFDRDHILRGAEPFKLMETMMNLDW